MKLAPSTAMSLLALLSLTAPFAARAEPTRAVTITVRGRGSTPLADVQILRRVGSKWEPIGRTDETGKIHLTDATLDGSWVVRPWIEEELTPTEWSSPGPVEVTTQDVSIDLECGAFFTVDVLDAETGSAIPGAEWRLHLGGERNTPWTSSGGRAWALAGPDGYRPRLQVRVGPRTSAREPGRHDTVERARGNSYWLYADGDPLPDHSTNDAMREGLASGHALERRVLAPVRRAATVKVQAYGSDGRPSRPAKANWYLDDGRVVPKFASTPVRARAKDVLLTLPFFRGGRVWIGAKGTDADGEGVVGCSLVHLPSEVPAGAIITRLDLEVEPVGRGGGLIGVGGGEGLRVFQSGGPRLEVRANRHDGTPIAGGRVRIRSDEMAGEPVLHPVCHFTGVTDSSGVLRVADLPPDGYTVSIEDDRFIAAAQHVALSERGKVTRVDLREPRGATIDVAVVDAAGKPMPFAYVRVTGPAGGHGDVGVEPRRVDPFVDALGRRTFVHVDPGRVSVTARWGAWEFVTAVDVQDGGRAVATAIYDPGTSK